LKQNDHQSRAVQRRRLAIALALGALSAQAAFAQDYHQVAPQQPKHEGPESTFAWPFSPQSAVRAGMGKLLLAEVQGLAFVDDPKKIVKDGVKGYGIMVDPALDLLERSRIKSQLARFLGRPLYSNDLQAISQRVVAWYRAHNFPLTEVTFPEQDVTSGTLQILVTVFRVGHVKVEGNRWFSAGALKDEMQLEPGDPFDFGELKDDLDRLNRNPFRQVTAVLERSAVPENTDLALKVQDRLPVRIYASFDDDGLPVTDRDRYSLGFNWGDVFGLDEQLSYQFMASPDIWQKRDRGAGHSDAPRLMAHSASYLAPLPWGDSVTLFGTYVQQVPDLGADFDQVGHSLQMSFRYDKSLPSMHAFSQQLHFGFDYKRSDNNLAFGGTQIFAGATDIRQFLLIYDASLPDAYGQTTLEDQFVYSPGGLSNRNNTAAFVASGVNGATADYVYDALQITRVTSLPWQTSAVLKLNGQIASTELLPSEQMGAGGPDSVRGYDPRVVNGSQGALASFELRSPSFGPLQALGTGIADAGQILAFYDAGFVSDFHMQTGQPQHATLQSVGGGVRYGLGRFVDVRFDYGIPLSKLPGGHDNGGLANLAVTLAY
jgi:hemolysin activation/secretion protein